MTGFGQDGRCKKPRVSARMVRALLATRITAVDWKLSYEVCRLGITNSADGHNCCVGRNGVGSGRRPQRYEKSAEANEPAH